MQIRDAMANLVGEKAGEHRHLPRLNILWVVKLGEHRRLVPAGLALINTKQTIVNSGVGARVNLLAASTSWTSRNIPELQPNFKNEDTA